MVSSYRCFMRRIFQNNLRMSPSDNHMADGLKVSQPSDNKMAEGLNVSQPYAGWLVVKRKKTRKSVTPTGHKGSQLQITSISHFPPLSAPAKIQKKINKKKRQVPKLPLEVEKLLESAPYSFLQDSG